MKFTFRLPDVGEGIHEAEIVKYEVEVGDFLKVDQPLLKIETDKAVVSLPAPVAGKVLEIPHNLGATVTVGDALVLIETDERVNTDGEEKISKDFSGSVKTDLQPSLVTPEKEKRSTLLPVNRVLATPRTRLLARELGVDITKIIGSGKGGRILEEDLKKNSSDRKETPKIPRPASEEHEPSTQGFDFEKYGPVKLIPFKGIRKRIAEVMVRSVSTIPHVTHADEADITDLVNLIEKQKKLEPQSPYKLTILPFVLKASIAALKLFPEVNSSLDEEKGNLVYKEYYNIGIATHTENGLMVPVIKGADKKTILQLTQDIKELSEKARTRSIDLNEMRGGTFTITNIGAIGGTHATPIILHPQVAILGVMRAQKKPVVIEDQIVVRMMLPLIVSFDHRLLDGATMAKFINHIKLLLQNPLKMMIEGLI